MIQVKKLIYFPRESNILTSNVPFYLNLLDIKIRPITPSSEPLSIPIEKVGKYYTALLEKRYWIQEVRTIPSNLLTLYDSTTKFNPCPSRIDFLDKPEIILFYGSNSPKIEINGDLHWELPYYGTILFNDIPVDYLRIIHPEPDIIEGYMKIIGWIP